MNGEVSVLKRVRALILLDWRTKLLLLEAFIFLGWARILILLPFSKVSSGLGIPMEETPQQLQFSSDWRVGKNIHQAIYIMSRYTPWESKCLVRAIAGLKMLERRKVESTIYFGTARDELGKMEAHAWLRCGSIYITGEEEMHRFAVVGKFAKRIIERETKGS